MFAGQARFSSTRQGGSDHALNPSDGGPDRGWRHSLAHQSIHPYGAGFIKSILNAVVVIVVVLWLLDVFGVLGSLSHIRVGK
jgi:hypothetical protein